MKKGNSNGLKIFIDFDDALFNTKNFKKDLIRVFMRHGVSEEEFEKSYKAYKTVRHQGISQYDPVKQIKVLEKNIGVEGKKILKDLELFLENTSKYVFKDVKSFLEKMEKKRLYLISFGSSRFQRMKMKNTKILKYFEKVKITDKLKSHAINQFFGKRKNLQFFFIDDRVDQIDPVKKAYPKSITILLKRKEGRYQHEKTKYVDYEIKNFKEIENILRSKY